MGACGSNKCISEPKEPFKQFQSLEKESLRLMYNDLSSRSSENGIIREQFDIFFHLNGLWSSQIYKKFDAEHKGFVSFQQFAYNILYMTKGNFQEKSLLLFQLYKSEEKLGVTYKSLVKMFYSYPKEEIQKMVNDERFLRTIDRYQLHFFFDPQQKIKDNITIEVSQKQENDRSQQLIQILPPEEMKKMHDELSETLTTFKRLSSKKLQRQVENGEGSLKSMPIPEYLLTVQKKKSVRKNSEGEQPKIAGNLKLTSNITFLVKKYVSFIFKQFKLDKFKDCLNLQQFRVLIKNHEKIFDTYFQAFHTYVWQYTNEGIPLYKTLSPNYESEAVQIVNHQKSEKYLVFIKTTLFVFQSKNQLRPNQIKSLQGLNVKDLESEGELNGILIFHRDGTYPQTKYVFASNQLKNEWLTQLNDYIKGSINQKIQFVQTIGAGRSAKVYLGREKKSNQQIAIKVIEKNHLSKQQNEAIKKQCQILKLCHHPHILKFIKNYDTKTRMYIMTEFLDEGDLFEYIRQKVFLEQYEAAIVFKQLVETIQYLSEVGLIHRDLKPQNVMIQLNQQKTCINKVKLIDFGFAVFKKQLQIMPIEQKYAGTPGYISPEMLSLEQFDQGSDVFSLGIILYLMLSGYLPFYSPIYQQIVEQTKICSISLRNSHWSNISKDARNLVQGLITFKQKRLTLNQLLDHPWLKDIQELKQYEGMNRRGKKKK